MNLMLKSISAITLSLSCAAALAAPQYLVTHNKTNEQSNAYIAGTIPSAYPTEANSSNKVHWNLVRLACYGRTTNGKCPALIKMATNTNNPINVGYVSMDLESGDITPKTLTGGGYTLTVTGVGEATIVKDATKLPE